MLSLSACLIPNITSKDLSADKVVASPSTLIKMLFFFSLYLVAVGQGGHKPCVQAFGADQFDGGDPEDRKARSSFFNWWYLSLSAGVSLAILVVVYIQDSVSWALGFGLPCVFMVISLALFLLGRKTYRYARVREEENPFSRIGRVFVVAFKNRRLNLAPCQGESEAINLSQRCPERLEFLNRALLGPNASGAGDNVCKIRDVEEATALVRLLPIWTTTLGYFIPYAQYMTFFTKQGVTMNRKISPSLEIPPASLQILIGISIILFVPIYDRVFVPVTRSITHVHSGITLLQRIGAGMVLSAFTMAVAALVETKRLQVARDHGLINQPNATVPISVWWLVPQYLLLGLADVFTLVGMQEFFYDQVPEELRSIGLALYLSALGVGSFLSSFLISIIDSTTGGDTGDSWFNGDLNRAHLDYFYWLLAGLSTIGFSAFLYFAKSYVYHRRGRP